MSRSLWRWWETKEGADVWWARVEERPGAWRDVPQAEYERAGLEPPFWDLPLKDEYLEGAMHFREDAETKTGAAFRTDFVLPGIIVLVLVFCVLFVVWIVGEMLLVKLGFIH